MIVINEAISIIKQLSFIHEVYNVEDYKDHFAMTVSILSKKMETALSFKVIINSMYPMKLKGQETIHFIAPNLMNYDHIMKDGFLCLHTIHSTDWKVKIKQDFEQLYQWIEKYYINKEHDLHYDHLVVEYTPIDDKYYSFIFTNTQRAFDKNEYGTAKISQIRSGVYNGKPIVNNLIQGFQNYNSSKENSCAWAKGLTTIPAMLAPYIFIQNPPSVFGKFSVESFNELSDYVTQDQLGFIHQCEDSLKKKNKGIVIPLLIGYIIPEGEIHWQAAMLKIGNFPLLGKPEYSKEETKTGHWLSEFTNQRIPWAITCNVSDKYYFGRGAFPNSLTKKNILIIGVGAIGSIVAKTIAKCGCKKITISDIDTKYPENVCRSEYEFTSGICDKTQEMMFLLSRISPEIQIASLDSNLDFLIKASIRDAESKETTKGLLNSFDLIFDCTTDNDLMFALQEINCKSQIVNLSISNHANDLICAFSPNIYGYVCRMFEHVIKSDSTDMFYPTGCWSPTFKASYNDINSMVQYALKHIVKMLCGEEIISNFVLSDSDNGLKIRKC